jgi:hypothetical protein
VPVTEPEPTGNEPARPRPSRTITPNGASVAQETALDDLALLESLPPPEPPIEIPDAARRPIDFVGAIDEGAGGLGPDAFGRADGRFLSTLMRNLDAPTPSRWGAMLMRRALISRCPRPPMSTRSTGSPNAPGCCCGWARPMRHGCWSSRSTSTSSLPRCSPSPSRPRSPRPIPAGLCPLVGPGRKTSDEAVWPLAEAMCASLSGEPGKAASLIEAARRRRRADPIDLDLAEKVVGAGANSRRAVTIEWDDVDRINSWRFGLAAATGMEIPDRLMAGAGAHVRAWQARAPMIPVEQRLAAIQAAASLGVLSSAALVDTYSLMFDTTDPSEVGGSVGGRLRIAYAARDPGARLRAIRSLWDEAGNDQFARHARMILTATAAARMPAAPVFAGEARPLIRSMLTAGYDARAARWSDVVGAMEAGENADRAWAMLALASPQPTVEISAGRVETFQDSDDSDENHATRLLVAALAGLERLDSGDVDGLAEDMDLRLRRGDAMVADDRPGAERGQTGTVALLAGVGMQTGAWRGVPAEHLFHITRALRRVGLEYEARMIAAEAIARL